MKRGLMARRYTLTNVTESGGQHKLLHISLICRRREDLRGMTNTSVALAIRRNIVFK